MITGRDKGALRLALTLLQVSRIIPGWKEPDLSTVTDKGKKNLELFSKFQKILPKIMLPLVGQLHIDPWTVPHMTTKAGPQGGALMTSLNDLANLPSWMFKSIWKIGGDELREYKTALYKGVSSGSLPLKSVKEDRKGILRRLSVIKDTEGKSRVIAIGDYWTQTCKKSIHKAK